MWYLNCHRRVFGLARCAENGLAEAAEYDFLHMEDLLNAPDDHTLQFIYVRWMRIDLVRKFTYGSYPLGLLLSGLEALPE